MYIQMNIQKYLNTSLHKYILIEMTDTIKVSMNIDKETWKKFRVKCLEESKTATEVVGKMIVDHLKKSTSK